MPRTYTEAALASLLIGGLLCILYGAIDPGFIGLVVMVVGLGMVALAIILAIPSIQRIPFDPPSVAMPAFIIGGRYDVIIREGLVFVFPWLENLVIGKIEPVTEPFVFDGVSCLLKREGNTKSSGGLVTFEGAYTYRPDYDDPSRYRRFLDNGGHAGIKRQLNAIAGQAVKDFAGDETFEGILFGKKKISVYLIELVTGQEPTENTPEAYKVFLDGLLANGLADVKSLGIKLFRFNVEEVQPEGKLRENIDRAAAELLQRPAEQEDTKTRLSAAMLIVYATGMDDVAWQALPTRERREWLNWALELDRINNNRASEAIFRGLEGADSFTRAALLPRPPESDRTSPQDSTSGA